METQVASHRGRVVASAESIVNPVRRLRARRDIATETQ